MTFEFIESKADGKIFDPTKCKASVWTGPGRWHDHQCTFKPWKDGWCKIHHPDTETAKGEKREAKFRARMNYINSNAEARRKEEERIRGLDKENAKLLEALRDMAERWEAVTDLFKNQPDGQYNGVCARVSAEIARAVLSNSNMEKQP